jgi:exopolysaccharide biosynthesis polyprenyl glycosylphosphotransferase
MIGKKAFSLYFLVTDFAAAMLGWVALLVFRLSVGATSVDQASAALQGGVFVGLFWVILYALAGFYKDVLRKSRSREIIYMLAIITAGGLIFTFLLINRILLDNEDLSEYRRLYEYLFLYLIFHLSFSVLFKLLIMGYSKYLIRKKILHFKTLIIGSDKQAADVYDEIEKKSAHLGLLFLGYVKASETNGHKHAMENYSLPCLGNLSDLEALVVNQNIEQVIIALEKQEHDTLQQILTSIEGYGVRTAIVPDIYQILLGSVKITQLFGTPIIEIKTDIMPVWQQAVKRIIDIGAALFVLTIGFPFLLAIAIATKLTSKGPIFFFQERVGKSGVPFKIIKFRSMYTNAEQMGPQLSSTHDPRVTPWGRVMRRTRLDEFPQFWNVLVGEMSLVGPRPERQHFIDQIVKVAPHYKHLNRVRPGITSLGQVKFGYAENVDQMVRRLKFDILYIENMSLAMDFRILAYTVLTMLQGRGK